MIITLTNLNKCSQTRMTHDANEINVNVADICRASSLVCVDDCFTWPADNGSHSFQHDSYALVSSSNFNAAVSSLFVDDYNVDEFDEFSIDPSASSEANSESMIDFGSDCYCDCDPDYWLPKPDAFQEMVNATIIKSTSQTVSSIPVSKMMVSANNKKPFLSHTNKTDDVTSRQGKNVRDSKLTTVRPRTGRVRAAAATRSANINHGKK